MGLLQQRELRLNPEKPRVHFFNTFFYNALFADKRTYLYKGVNRWTSPKRLKGYSILDCDKVVVPIHQGVHWVLAVINLAQSSLSFLDSMGGGDNGALDNLAKYISDEFMDKRQQEEDTRGWGRHVPGNIPHQHNCSDCGVFMVTFAEFESRNREFVFSQRDMPFIRRRMVAEMLNGSVQ
eukprot:CAMPEP_0118945558 /NCGR_PEP_ID=MMETSP1169-20130426/42513_1 /TAXON_ID=36882 /ORGANISM="Pyramimonas obovata, Strain CCMP722" /LENGTH=179 /DNA_ID=CAMNT_0006891305 /DNA_START=1 /DNA_END=540 /DNA_ORIENTATION=+